METSDRFYPHELKRFCQEALLQVNVPQADAELVAESLVDADSCGMGSHGIARLPVYIEAIEKRIFNPTPKFQKLTESASMALLDGDNSLGQVIGTKAMKLAVEKAKDTGVGIVGAKNVGHLGRLAFIAQIALEHHCVGGIMGNTQPMMAPWGGASKKIGNNPFAIAVPKGSEGSVILDMSCSVVSKGRIRQAAFQKEVIPKDWALDEDGVPTDNPKRALEGMLLPFGRYKGYGIALMIDIFAGIMTGAGFSTNLGTLYPLGDKPLRHGTLTFAFDPFVFIPKKEFTEKLDSLLQDIKSPPFAKWASKIYAPGEPEKERKAKISREGVHLTEVVYSEIEKLGQRLGISPPRPFRSENERGINGPV